MRMLSCCVWLLAPSLALAGDAATTARVTPEGVFFDTQAAPTPPAPKGTIHAATNPNPSATGLRWAYPNPAGMPWITESVSVGNRGTFAWLGQNQNFERVSLFGTTDDQPLPIYEDASLVNADWVGVAAADKAPVCAVARRDTNGGIFDVMLYSGFDATPVAVTPSASTGSLEIAISDDGERVAVGFTDALGVPVVELYHTGGGSSLSLASTLQGFGTAFREHDISGDGNVVLLATQNSDILLDANNGSVIFTDNSTVSVDAHAIDFDGDTWVRGGFDLGAWRSNGGTYNRLVNFKDTSMGFFVSTACDVSSDGSTFVAAAYDAFNNNAFGVYVFDLDAPGAPLLWSFKTTGTGSFQDTPQEVSVSDDGRWIAVASWGTASNSHAEVLLFDRDAGNVPVGGIDTPGSAFSCDISGDGQFVVAGTKAVHANTFGNGGEGYSLDRGGQGFRLFGTPSVGRTISFVEGGAPGDPVLLMASLALLPSPLTATSFMGTFDLDPTSFLLAPTFVGTVPGSGQLALPVTLPPGPFGIGVTVYVQAIRGGATPSIDNYLALPITP